MAVTPFNPSQWKTHVACMQTSWLYVLQNRCYYRSKFYVAGIGFFYLFGSCDLDPMTFIYKLDEYSLEIYHTGKNELTMSTLSKVII